MSFLSKVELQSLGLRSVGANVRISRFASFHRPEQVSVGDRTRIDDFVVVSGGDGGIDIGRNVHIAVYTSLMGGGPIRVEDYANLSSRVAVYSSNDDYSGATMTNPTIPSDFTGVVSRPVTIGSHAIIGAGAIILPGVTVGSGAAVGALSLVRDDCPMFGVYVGVPARRVGTRQKRLLELAAQYERSLDEK